MTKFAPEFKLNVVVRITSVFLTLFIYCLSTFAQVCPDSVFTDSISGNRMRLQVLSQTDTLVHVKPRPFLALAEDLSINALVVSFDYFIGDREWARVSKNDIKRNFRLGWEWDDDSFSGNMFSHPYHGSMFYNAARANGMSYGISLLYPLIGSWSWEMFCENNRPAVNDLFATGIGGSAIGEVTHRASDLVFDNSKRGLERVFHELAGTLLNPVRGFKRFFSGEMLRYTPNSKGKRVEPKPYHFEIGIGNRYIAELSTHPEFGRKYYQNIPALDMTLEYGDHFNAIDGGKNHPFDQFSVYALMNLASQNPTFGILDISGRIFSRQVSGKKGWDFDYGFYQNYKYVEDYQKEGNLRSGFLPVISEAASFGAGVYAEKNGKTPMSNLLMLSAVPLGSASADYYCSEKLSGIHDLFPEFKRKYNFGSGYSIRENFHARVNSNLTLGNRFYFMQIFTFNGYDPKHVVTHSNSVMGDKGYSISLTNTLYAHVNLSKNIKFKLEYMYYFRNGVYDYYENLKGSSHELKTTLSYSI